MSRWKREHTGNACPNCGAHKVACKDSRFEGGRTRRRRFCRACDHSWTTYEIEADELRQMERVSRWADSLARSVAALLPGSR